MRRRHYLSRVGAGLGVGLAGLAGCGAPGEQAGTESPGAETTTTAGGTETTGGGTTRTNGGGGAGAQNETGTGTEPTDTGTTNTGTTNTGTTTTGTAGGQQVPNSVAMVTEGSEYYFNPIGLFVEPGETITWVNEAGSHSTTAYTQDNPQSEVDRIPDDAEGWNSGILSEEGAEFTHTFEVQGTYDYYCIPHKTLGMVGRLVVGEPSGIEGDPPDGPVPSEQAIVEQGAVTVEEFQP